MILQLSITVAQVHQAQVHVPNKHLETIFLIKEIKIIDNPIVPMYSISLERDFYFDAQRA